MTKLLAAVASVVFLTSCVSKTAATAAVPTPPTDAAIVATQLELKLDQEVEADGLRLTWTSLNDSRCARGVTCVWAGEVTVELSLRESGQDQSSSLTIGPRPDIDTAQTARHELRLLEVTPYPIQGVQPERRDYRARVELRRR